MISTFGIAPTLHHTGHLHHSHHPPPPMTPPTHPDTQIAFFDRNDTGELTSRLSADAAKLSNVVSFHINIIVRQSIQVLYFNTLTVLGT